MVINLRHFCTQETFGNVWRHSGLSHWGALLASSGKRPGMLLNILQCTGQTGTTVEPKNNQIGKSDLGQQEGVNETTTKEINEER